jgi:hypothetical protein
MTRWSATTPTPPPLLRARLRLALHSSGGNTKTKVVHHERGRYSGLLGLAGPVRPPLGGRPLILRVNNGLELSLITKANNSITVTCSRHA